MESTWSLVVEFESTFFGQDQGREFEALEQLQWRQHWLSLQDIRVLGDVPRNSSLHGLAPGCAKVPLKEPMQMTRMEGWLHQNDVCTNAIGFGRVQPRNALSQLANAMLPWRMLRSSLSFARAAKHSQFHNPLLVSPKWRLQKQERGQ